MASDFNEPVWNGAGNYALKGFCADLTVSSPDPALLP